MRPEPRINILFLHAGAERYGADNILLSLIKGLDRQRFNPVVILPNTGPLQEELSALNIPIRIFEFGVLRRKYMSFFGLINRFHYISIGLIRVIRIARKENINIIHTNTSTILVGGMAAKILRVPHVWHIHEITERPKIVWKLLSYIIPRLSDKVIAVSHAVRQHLIRGSILNELRALVIHNGIDMEPYFRNDGSRIRKEYNVSKDNIFVGMIGRVNSWKGQHAFIDTAKILIKCQDNVYFIMSGGTFEGEEGLFMALRNRIDIEGLTNRIFLSDYRKDIPDVLAALDVFVLPSIKPDPLPTVVLEAMASGKPVVSFSHGGATEMIINRETGILVPVDDIRKMAEAIKELIDNKAMRLAMGKKGKERCEKYYSKREFDYNIESLFTRLQTNRM